MEKKVSMTEIRCRLLVSTMARKHPLAMRNYVMMM
jgi:hypothetical protein